MEKKKHKKLIALLISAVVGIGVATTLYFFLQPKIIEPFEVIKVNEFVIIEYGDDLADGSAFYDISSYEQFASQYSGAIIELSDINTKENVSKEPPKEILDAKDNNIKPSINEEIKSNLTINEFTVTVIVNDRKYTKDGEYIVIDTNLPEISGIKEKYEILEGDDLIIDAKANDIIDGELDVVFDPIPDNSKVGDQLITASSQDKNGNNVMVDFYVHVTEKKLEEKALVSNVPVDKTDKKKEEIKKSNQQDKNQSNNKVDTPLVTEKEKEDTPVSCDPYPNQDIGNAGIIFGSQKEAEDYAWKMLELWRKERQNWSDALRKVWFDERGNRKPGFEDVAEFTITEDGHFQYKFKPDKNFKPEWDYHGFLYGTLINPCDTYDHWFVHFY